MPGSRTFEIQSPPVVRSFGSSVRRTRVPKMLPLVEVMRAT